MIVDVDSFLNFFNMKHTSVFKKLHSSNVSQK